MYINKSKMFAIYSTHRCALSWCGLLDKSPMNSIGNSTQLSTNVGTKVLVNSNMNDEHNDLLEPT